MKICLINFDAYWKDKQKNIEKMWELIMQALKIKSDTSTIVFPELALNGYVLDKDVFDLAEDIDGDSITEMRKIAKENNINLIFGFIEANGEDKPYNSVVVIWRDWEIITKYHKNHLFTESVEPEIYSAWEELSVFELEWWKCGLSICFDIRYPRLYEVYKHAGVECVITPYAWVDGRNKPDIFTSLSKARSSENQFFMVWVDCIWKDANNSYAGNAVISNPYSEDIKQTHEEIFHFAHMQREEIYNLWKVIPLEPGFKTDYNLK